MANQQGQDAGNEESRGSSDLSDIIVAGVFAALIPELDATIKRAGEEGLSVVEALGDLRKRLQAKGQERWLRSEGRAPDPHRR